MKLAVVGSINMDMTVTAERIPLKGETLRGDSLHYISGGKGANQAVAMAKLGAKVEMFGCVGDDANGTRLLENFKKVGVETGHIKVLVEIPYAAPKHFPHRRMRSNRCRDCSHRPSSPPR